MTKSLERVENALLRRVRNADGEIERGWKQQLRRSLKLIGSKSRTWESRPRLKLNKIEMSRCDAMISAEGAMAINHPANAG